MVIGWASCSLAFLPLQLMSSSKESSSKSGWSQAPNSQGFGRLGMLIASLLRDEGVRPSSTMNFAISSSCLLEIASQDWPGRSRQVSSATAAFR